MYAFFYYYYLWFFGISAFFGEGGLKKAGWVLAGAAAQPHISRGNSYSIWERLSFVIWAQV